MNIFHQLRQDIIAVANTIEMHGDEIDKFSIEIPKDPIHGDISTNIAMLLAANLKVNPREIALNFKKLLSEIEYIADVEVAGPGFINFTIKRNKWYEVLNNILNNINDFKRINIGKGQKINIEYVSANPTGPMHIGHARGAVFGDTLANILSISGYAVTKEYYINDTGNQIQTLAKTSIMRYEEALTGNKITIPNDLYPGEYLIPVGQKILELYGRDFHSLPTNEKLTIAKNIALSEMMNLIKQDLQDLGVKHDLFFSEQILHDNGQIEKTVSILEGLSLIYNGILPAPKGKLEDDWVEREQKLFKSTNFGDDQDRPIQKADGSWTYFASDLAYANDKIERGYKKLIYVLGADHGGYVKRIKGVIKALSDNQVKSDVLICQLVNFMDGGIPVKMSKRKGSFTTVKDVIEAVGRDIVRFIMLTRKNDMPLDFDLQAVYEQSKDNPVFYVQYAHVRAISIIEKAKHDAEEAYLQFIENNFDLEMLSSEEEIRLIKLLASWPKILESAANSCEPHRIALYLNNVASEFHSLWNFSKENNNYRFVVQNDTILTAARLALASAVQKILAVGFEVIAIEPMCKM